MRQTTLVVLAALFILLAPAAAIADSERCGEQFPGVDWVTYPAAGPATVATAGMTPEMSERFAADVSRVALLVDGEIGGMAGAAACLATADLASSFSDLVAPGQRLHVGVFGEERILVLSAVEIRMVDDAIAFGLPHIALWAIGEDLGLEAGFPEPLGSTVAHWYLARETNRLERYYNELVVTLFLDDPNPEERTLEDAALWVGDSKPEPYFFDPQFIGSQMGVFVDFAVAERGVDVLRDVDQATWAELERAWRISIRDQFPRGSYGVWWGVTIVIGFVGLAIFLAWSKRRSNRKAAERRPTPPPDESLFSST